MAKYMLLLHDNTSAFANISPEQMQKVIEKYVAWGKRLREKGHRITLLNEQQFWRLAPRS